MTGWLFGLTAVVAVAAAIRGLWSPCGLSMLSTLTPFGERARGHRYGWSALWFVVGAVLGGAALGAVAAGLAGLVGLTPLSPTGALAIAAGLAFLAAGADGRVAGLRVPTHPRQVNETWIGRYRRWIYAAGFGAQIGAGLATYVMTAGVYLLIAMAALTGSPAAGLAIGVLFGLVRGLGVLIGARVTDPGRLRHAIGRLERLAPRSLSAMIVVESMVGVLAVGAATSSVVVAGLAAAVLIAALTLLRFWQYRPGFGAILPRVVTRAGDQSDRVPV